MKKKDLNDLRNKTAAELETLAAKTRGEIVKARLDLAMRRSKNTNVVSNLRKNLAQTLTVVKELNNQVKK